MYKKFVIDAVYYDKLPKSKEIYKDISTVFQIDLTDSFLKELDDNIQNMTEELHLVDKHIINKSVTKYPIEYLFRLYLCSFMLGDTIGYFNGKWEFNNNINPSDITPEYVNELLYEFINLGGVNNFDIENLRVSDDTILMFATASVLAEKLNTIEDYGTKLKIEYLKHFDELKSRHPGETTMRSLNILKNAEWSSIQYNGQDFGNGAVMRCGMISFFYSPSEPAFIYLAIETSRLTHNSALSILGCISIAFLVHCAIYEPNVDYWLTYLIKYLEETDKIIQNYIKTTRPNELTSFNVDKLTFMGQIKKYYHLKYVGDKLRTDMINIFDNPVRRYKYLSESYSKKNLSIPGGCADDSIIFALDSIIESKENYEKLILYSALHPGDSDTVAALAFSLFFLNNNKYIVPSAISNFEKTEFYSNINDLILKSKNKLFVGYIKNLLFEVTYE
jgi:ADP-ribosylglycohydrolase